MKSAWDVRRGKGIRDGRKEGVGIGDNRRVASVVLNMHEREMNISDIAAIVEKPESEVQSIINNGAEYAFAQA